MEQSCASSQSSATDLASDERGDSSPTAFWPSNGASGQQVGQLAQDSPAADSLAESLAQVSLSSSGHSAVGRSPGFSPNAAAALLGSVSSCYWSTGGGSEADTSFLNGSAYSQSGYSSGGSSSGSPQSPLTRPTSRPITGAKQPPMVPQPAQPAMYCKPPPDKQAGSGWKSGAGVWAPFPAAKAGLRSLPGHFGQKEKEWKDSRLPLQQQHVGHSLPSAGFRQMGQLSRPGMSATGARPVLSQSQPQDLAWQVGPGGWAPSLNFHAARKFGRRRGNAPF